MPPPPPHPPPPPAVPAPYLEWEGGLRGSTCDAMWADKAGLLRKMWADQPFMQRTQERLTCFVVRRDDTNGRQRAEQFFDETERGLHCNSNW